MESRILMRRRVRFQLVLLLVALTASADDWKTFHFEEGGFSISFPTPPSKATMQFDTVFGTVQATLHSVNAGSMAFFAGYYDVPAGSDSSVTTLLDAERDRGLANTRCSLVSDKPFTSQGRTGREIVADQSTGTNRLRARNLVVGKRLYSLIAVGSKDPTMDAASAKFFESFSIP